MEQVKTQGLAPAAVAAAAAPGRAQWSDAAAEGALAKVGAAANAMTKRAEAASRELLKAEQSLSSRERAMQGPSAQGHKKQWQSQSQWQRGSYGKAGKGGRGNGKPYQKW